MARIWSCGLELADFAKEGFDDIGAGAAVSTLAARSGTYGMRISTGNNASSATKWYRAADTAEDVYYRLYLRVNSRPSTGVHNPILIPATLSGTSPQVSVDLTVWPKLRLYNLTTNTQIGSESVELARGQWYRVELRVNSTVITATEWTLLLDGEIVATTTVNATGGYQGVGFGLFQNWSGTETWSVDLDDFAVNDSTGTEQTSYPGNGRIVHLFVTGDGDTTNRGAQGTGWDTGPTTGLAAYTGVDERPTPDDATSYLQLMAPSSGPTDDVVFFAVNDCSVSGIAPNMVILVQVGARISGLTATSCSYVLMLKSQSAGTIVESATITLASASWFAHDDTDPKVYKLTAYVYPQAGGEWTPALLDTMQIGVRAPDATPDVLVTHLWALVEYADEAPIVTNTIFTTTSG